MTYTYDREGRQKTIVRDSVTTSLAYNDANQLTGESTSGGVLNGLAVSNRYDALLRRATNGLWNGSAWLAQSRYGYDAASRLQAVTDGLNPAYSAGYAYLANSPLLGQIRFTNNTTRVMLRTNRYDFLNRLVAVSNLNGSATAAFKAVAYACNDANQRTSVTNADGSRWVYTYDALGQVATGKKYWSDGTPVAGQQFEYGFDDTRPVRYGRLPLRLRPAQPSRPQPLRWPRPGPAHALQSASGRRSAVHENASAL